MTNYVFGADGVGRGNFAGINIWCICGIPKGVILPVKDSKKTNKKQRANIIEQIKDKCIWSLGSSTPKHIDTWHISYSEESSLITAYLNLTKQSYLIDHLYGDLGMPNLVRLNNSNIKNIYKLKDADDSIPAVSAASIFAKYALDLYWDRIHEHYPQYDFINNAGYGIKAKQKIAKFGLIESIHRYSYKPCKEYLHETIL